MTHVIVILDGASEPVRGDEPTSLELAATPVLDALAQLGTLHRFATTPDGLPAGSETGCAVLLGWVPSGPVDRVALETAARGIELRAGELARRVDVFAADGTRAGAELVAAVQLAAARALQHDRAAEVHRLGDHRLLVAGEPDAVERAIAAAQQAAPGLREWPPGLAVPRRLDDRTVVISAAGAVLGLARLLGARTITPEGYRGGSRAVLSPLAEAAVELLAGGADAAPGEAIERIVIHVDAPDEAAHERSPRRKVAAIEAADVEVLLPITAALHELGGTLDVVIDHGCDPQDGTHGDAPTPALRWTAGEHPAAGSGDDASATDDPAAGDATDPDHDPDAPGLRSGLDPEDLPLMALPKRRAHATAQTGRRLTERWVAPLPVDPPDAVAAALTDAAIGGSPEPTP